MEALIHLGNGSYPRKVTRIGYIAKSMHGELLLHVLVLLSCSNGLSRCSLAKAMIYVALGPGSIVLCNRSYTVKLELRDKAEEAARASAARRAVIAT